MTTVSAVITAVMKAITHVRRRTISVYVPLLTELLSGLDPIP